MFLDEKRVFLRTPRARVLLALPNIMRRVEAVKVEVILPPASGVRQQRELSAFVRYCIKRIERDLGACDRWAVSIEPSMDSEYVSTVEAVHRGVRLVASGRGVDGVLATWNAICRLEQTWRERAPWIARAV